MPNLLDRINKKLDSTGLQSRSDTARKWLMSQVSNLRPNTSSLMKDREKLRTKTIIGRMYFFFYDPKTKEKLQYYDRFPLVIPIKRYNDGFLGLNLHYIHPKFRIKLLDKLSVFLNNDQFDETTRLKLTYPSLEAASRIYEHKPCLKRYLFSHVNSRFLEITADQWDIAILLPIAKFKSEKMRTVNQTEVWSDSKEQF